ncbi:MAG: T9SS type A sorting domain-containing protein, partial [Saprospiraceae bacterium]|nr:T9SS type A sorting domain-containing protein [Saprospiraceae bacterium]
TATDTVVVTIITSVADMGETYTIKASPNPAHDFIDILCTGASMTAVQIIDSPGKVRMSEKVLAYDGASHRMSLTNLSPGMYFIRITIAAGFVKIIPFIKQ